MQIEYIKTKDLIPYANNPRINDDAARGVAQSIKDYGFRIPVIIDKNNVIVCGHTRLKAANLLGLEEIPCIRADDLSDEQIKAFRIVDNKTSELASWDEEKLKLEIADIDLDLDGFGLEMDIPDVSIEISDDGYYGDERERTADAYNMWAFNASDAEGFYQMPCLEPCDVIPSDLIGFNYVLSTEKKCGVHFFIDDYQFERVWSRPDFYIEKLKPFECVLTPDFSLYMNMAMPVKIWNTYRSRLIGQMMQRAGLNVIPTVSWAEEQTFAFAFAGLPEHATLAVSTIGVKNDPDALKVWKAGMDAMIKRKKPKRLIVYGGALDYDYRDIDVYYYDNTVTQAWKSERN